MSTIVEKVSEFKLVKEILALVNGGDQGKLDSFFSKIKKTLIRDVKALTQNLKVLEHGFTTTMEELGEQLEDAEQFLNDAYLSVDPTKIKTNAEQNAYMNTYLEAIKDATYTVNSIKDEKTKEKENYDLKVENINNEIKTLEEQIERITG